MADKKTLLALTVMEDDDGELLLEFTVYPATILDRLSALEAAATQIRASQKDTLRQMLSVGLAPNQGQR